MKPVRFSRVRFVGVGAPLSSVYAQTDGHLVVRPSMQRYSGWLRTLPVVGLVVVVGLIRGGSDGTGVAVVALSAVPLMVCLVGGVIGYMRRACVVVTATHIGRAGLSGRMKWCRRDEIGAAVTATMRYVGDGPTRNFENLFLFDHVGRRLLRIRSVHWLKGDIQRVVQALGVTPVELPGVLTGPEIAKRYPAAVRGPERHPAAYLALAAAALLGGGFGLAALARALGA